MAHVEPFSYQPREEHEDACTACNHERKRIIGELRITSMGTTTRKKLCALHRDIFESEQVDPVLLHRLAFGIEEPSRTR